MTAPRLCVREQPYLFVVILSAVKDLLFPFRRFLFSSTACLWSDESRLGSLRSESFCIHSERSEERFSIARSSGDESLSSCTIAPHPPSARRCLLFSLSSRASEATRDLSSFPATGKMAMSAALPCS